MRLIENKKWCYKCEDYPPLDYIGCTKHSDKHVWACVRPCRFAISIRKRSVFENFKYSFREIILFCINICWGCHFQKWVLN